MKQFRKKLDRSTDGKKVTQGKVKRGRKSQKRIGSVEKCETKIEKTLKRLWKIDTTTVINPQKDSKVTRRGIERKAATM